MIDPRDVLALVVLVVVGTVVASALLFALFPPAVPVPGFP